MPTLNEIYADLVKWGMPEHPSIEKFVGVDAIVNCAGPANTGDYDQYKRDTEAILTQHALEHFGDRIVLSRGKRGRWYCEIAFYTMDKPNVAGKGDTAILAIWDAAKQLGSEG